MFDGEAARGNTLMQAIICEKAQAVYADLLHQTPGTSTGEPLKASRSCFEYFEKRTGIHSDEAARADLKEAEDYLKTFAGIIAAEGYIPQQMFNCDVRGHFCQVMPRRTYITAAETGYLYK